MQNQRTIFYLIILATAVFGLLSACSPAEPEAPALTATPQLDSPALQSVDDTAAPVAPTPIPATGSDQTTGSTENTTTDAYPNEAYPAEVFAPPLPQTVREPYPAGVPQELTARNATPTAYPPSGANRTSDLGGAVDSELAGVRAISLEVIETFPPGIGIDGRWKPCRLCWQSPRRHKHAKTVRLCCRNGLSHKMLTVQHKSHRSSSFTCSTSAACRKELTR